MLRDGTPVELGPPRERALLARAHACERRRSRDRLIDELWPDDPPRSAANTLQTCVSHLRRALPLQTRPRAILDLEGFERLAEDGRRLLAAG